ncbi:deazapurine DNA modification protein DpdA family protein [Planosporangium mesophilum]|uniref:DeoxyPurine in DNA protein A domain-containing protein n=1 Tax=Planosporangium mesophilum TaxID=689768 RepID=A0A8J3TEG7_9ACTN|nr:hypothetical protein [Planosporangium mesophilum]NJC83678.1 hypothetical protein [Planosporangium mesophilum]GII25343.1 hypothetical protein Pme01_49400 [Planosporangium mesophilum]
MTALFYLGTHQPGWLAAATVPLFVSDRRLRGYRHLPRASAAWALDSGGFTELATHGSWSHGPTPCQYVARIRRYRDEIGRLTWAAPQDWMCEPWIVAKTGLSVAEHQRRTVANYQQLHDLAPDLPIVPVLQGWTVADYLRCADRYISAGVDLTAAPLVGLGTVCRRQSTADAGRIIGALHAAGIRRLHGFGFKVLGLRRYSHLLASADSMAWSVEARRSAPLPGCTRHINCANCPRYAYRWRDQVLAAIATPAAEQLALFDVA